MCHHCGKGFPTKVQLESHIRTHTGERPFICEYCPTTFSQQSNLYKHNRQPEPIPAMNQAPAVSVVLHYSAETSRRSYELLKIPDPDKFF
ncbi:Zinc finger protein 39 [Operophtera brumata]|uniref:Zinc finger protein 39 n=1 Tax=Operophtera brumata TaxID=104452 RepID=A0A0L7KUB4_OPEBR|nr:Zinc finger protein 39 [Operophtera brumata]